MIDVKSKIELLCAYLEPLVYHLCLGQIQRTILQKYQVCINHLYVFVHEKLNNLLNNNFDLLKATSSMKLGLENAALQKMCITRWKVSTLVTLVGMHIFPFHL
jgi:hypothetical protein